MVWWWLHHVDRATQRLEALAERDGLFDGVAARFSVGAAQSHADGIVRPHLAFDLGDHFQQAEAQHAVLKRPAVPVGALVGAEERKFDARYP